MHLRQPWFAYSVYGPFTRNKEEIQKKKTPKKQAFQDIFTKMN